MATVHRRWLIPGFVFLTSGAGLWSPWASAQPGLDAPPPLEAPITQPAPPRPEADDTKAEPPTHEALLPPATRTREMRAPMSPPPPPEERPTEDSPDPRATWVPGYWSWDQARNDFVWVGGVWQVPPRDSIWVGGRWMRDPVGWYRVAGSWGRRRAASTVGRVDWRKAGPPAEHPDDVPGPAPGPDYFLVAGHYAPDGDGLVWKSSFWARVQDGWDWVPARWVRRSGGWGFRAGYWTRESDVDLAGRQGPARPDTNSDLPPTDLDPLPDDRARTSPRDLLSEAEEAPRTTPGDPSVTPPLVIIPRGGRYRAPLPPMGFVNGVPMRVIRPPGSYPYGPAGVVVPDAVPPFVQRLLDRVLP